MNQLLLYPLAILLVSAADAGSDERPYGRGMTDANKERRLLDDTEDVSDWYNGSPEETTISASTQRAKQGDAALLFANVVDHTTGEKNYPVGWPRTGRDLAKDGPTDWSDYDFFECWIYVGTSRDALPKTPLGVGFYHSGHKRSTHIRLNEVKKNAWTKIVISIDELLDPKDVRRVQFNISESDYKHGDRVDFTIDDLVLTRYVNPAVAEFNLKRKILYSHDRFLTAQYKLVGHRGLRTTQVEIAIGQKGRNAVAVTQGPASRVGELVLPIETQLAPGIWRTVLSLRNDQGQVIDRKQAELRVIAGPFAGEDK